MPATATQKASNPFAAYIRAGMKKKGMSVEELAERSYMSLSMTRELVSGKIRAPHDKCLRTMARIFGTTLDHLQELAPGRVVKQDRPTNENGWDAEQTLGAAMAQPGRKFAKEAVGFRARGDAPQVCGACRFYLRDPSSEVGRCQVVAGGIPWSSTSSLYIGAEEEASAVLKQDEAFGPGVVFTPPHPAGAPLSDVADLWAWAETRLPVAVQCAPNGVRAIAEKSGDGLRLWFPGNRDLERLATFPEPIVDAFKAIPIDFVIDLDVGVLRQGKRLARPELEAIVDQPDTLGPADRFLLTVFDLPFAGEQDLHDQPFRERRDNLEEFFIGQLSGKGDDLFALSSLRWVDSRRELEAAVRASLRGENVDGVTAKAGSSAYELEGPTSSWASLRRVAELQVVVLEVATTPDGALVYTAGLSPSAAPAWENVTRLGGLDFVELGETLPTQVLARPGDILDVQALELVPRGEELRWSGATVLRRDERAEAPLSTNEALEVAARAQVLQKAALEFLPASLTPGARVSFVTTDPSPLELARDEPLVGGVGRTFTQVYLPALGLEKSEVAVIPAIPIPSSTGRPSVAEAVHWRGWVGKQLEHTGGLVVALGRVARAAAGDLAEFTLPHPAAVAKRGDNGELTRKARAIRIALSEANRGRPAEDARRASSVKQDEASGVEFWLEHWSEMFPPDGEGEFVVQRHYRGLTGDEAKLGDRELRRGDHSVHVDLRFTGPSGRGLWGVTLFASDLEDGRAEPKAEHEEKWISIARRAPHVLEPGEAGATSEAWAKLFELGSGSFKIGVWRESSFEFFLEGPEGLTGRWVFARTGEGDGNRRPWILRKPEDQTPIAEKEDLEKVLAELRRKRQRWLVWGKPGQSPQKINVRTGRVEKDIRIPIAKADQSKGIVYGVVLDPYQADLHGDWIPPADVEEAAHRFMERGQKINLRHREKLDAIVMESTLVQYPSEDDYRKAMAGEDHSIFEMPYGDQTVRSGTWLLGVKVRDATARAEAEAGELDAFSIEGLGIRRPAKRSEVPRVRIIELKPAA